MAAPSGAVPAAPERPSRTAQPSGVVRVGPAERSKEQAAAPEQGVLAAGAEVPGPQRPCWSSKSPGHRRRSQCCRRLVSPTGRPDGRRCSTPRSADHHRRSQGFRHPGRSRTPALANGWCANWSPTVLDRLGRTARGSRRAASAAGTVRSYAYGPWSHPGGGWTLPKPVPAEYESPIATHVSRVAASTDWGATIVSGAPTVTAATTPATMRRPRVTTETSLAG